jgi:hypothetical protein
MIKRLKKSIALLAMNTLYVASAFAVEITDEESVTIVDDTPVMSPRTSGAGGAYANFASGVDAAFANPAGIGGLAEKNKPGVVRQLHFPYVGLGVNQNTQNLNSDFSDQGGERDSSIGRAIIDAHAGARQYARASFFPNIGFSRIMIGPILDQQIAAVPLGDGSDLVNTHFRSQAGLGAGMSFTDPKGTLYLGVFTAKLSILEVKGDLVYSEMINSETRTDAIKDKTEKYSGERSTMGLLWKISKKDAAPSLSIVVHDLGNSRLENQNADEEALKFREAWTIGFGVSPKVTNDLWFRAALQSDDTTNRHQSVSEKVKFGMEFLYGDSPDHALFGLRAGYKLAGATFGADLNLGLINVQFSNYAEDVGANNTTVIERRSEVVGIIELAEF